MTIGNNPHLLSLNQSDIKRKENKYISQSRIEEAKKVTRGGDKRKSKILITKQQKNTECQETNWLTVHWMPADISSRSVKSFNIPHFYEYIRRGNSKVGGLEKHENRVPNQLMDAAEPMWWRDK